VVVIGKQFSIGLFIGKQFSIGLFIKAQRVLPVSLQRDF
jgi:hypothetical protein